MANFSGGDVVNITYNHPTLGSGTFFCKAGEDGTIDLGGKRTDDDAAMVTGAGQMIQKINTVLGSYESPPVSWDMAGTNELKALSDMAASSVLAEWTITITNGTIFIGTGKPVGDVNANTNSPEATLKLAFEGQVQTIS